MLDTDLNSPQFNSYASIDDCRAYAVMRGLSLPEDETELSQLLFKAMDYLESINWKGLPSDDEQLLSWPRTGLVKDSRKIPSNIIPNQVKDAQCYLAIISQETDLQPVKEGGAEVLSEAIAGAVSVSYANGTNSSQPSFPVINGLLRGLCYSSNTIKLIRG